MIPPKLLEQIAMYCAALPCPPLPVQLVEEGETVVTTSHDVLAGLLLLAVIRNNTELNEKRKVRQTQLVAEFLEKGTACTDVATLYEHCKRFTGEAIHAFDDAGGSTPAVMFLEMSAIAKGEKVHKAMASWNSAQDIIYVKDVGRRRNAAAFGAMDTACLFQVHLDRMQDKTQETVCFALPAVIEEVDA
jgi:hypothetical protein